ncbi:MAG TPA: YgaP-like transmembrane domain [Vicinamibacterales bacterium]
MPIAAPHVTVYGAEWCEDTRRTRRLLRRLAVPFRYHDVDEDVDALDRATTLGSGARRTPIVDVRGQALVEPSNAQLISALTTARLLSEQDVDERLMVQNVGDAERVLRVGGGAALMIMSGSVPRGGRLPLGLLGLGLILTGIAGWCPVYHAAGVSSLDGPADRPGEAERRAWLASSRSTGA